MEKNTERRSSPRAEIRWPVTIKTAQGIIEAKLRNLGIGGAYIHCEETLEAGEAKAIFSKNPDGQISISMNWQWLNGTQNSGTSFYGEI